MADILSKGDRSAMMRKIGPRNTKPELLVRSLLHRLGFRFRLHRRDLPGKPDIVLPRHRTVIFVHGCFWHRHAGCHLAYSPKSNVEFWQAKFSENISRDMKKARALRKSGWRVVTVWECQTRAPSGLEKRLHAALKP